MKKMTDRQLANKFTYSVQTGMIFDLLRQLSLPNIPMLTMGGHVFWNNLAECNGWRLQKNMITQHCRILDPHDVRRAWGGDDAMERLFSRILK